MNTLKSALQYAEAGKVEEWVHLFLNGEGDNVPFSDGLRLENRHKTEIDYDLTPELLIELSNKTDTSELLVIVQISNNSSASSLNVACAATVLMYEVERQK